MIRPELLAALARGREVIAAGVVAALGVWLAWLGGYLLLPLGLGVVALALAWGIAAWRRMRFDQGTDAPGVVEVDEAQIGYLGPGDGGGYVAIPDLVEIRLLRLRGRRLWQLRQSDGQVLLIPVDAAGAERLFDAFASLPGLDTSALVAALTPIQGGNGQSLVLAGEMRVLWRRRPRDAGSLARGP